MFPRRLIPWCLAAAGLLAGLIPVSAQEKKDDAAPLKFRIYGSLLPGYSKADSIGSSQPMLTFVGDKIGRRIECGVHDGTTPEDLLDFGKKLNGGEYHFAAVWGLEYGWLREKYPLLRVLTVVYGNETKSTSRTMLMVPRGGAAKKLADLKGKRLAVYRDMPLMDRLFLREMLRAEKLDPKSFFARTEPYPSVRHAAAAVKEGKADCLLISNTTHARLADLQPGLAAALTELASGENYPMPAIIGVPEVVNQARKRKGLWEDLRDQLLDVHNSPEGKECVSFWRFEYFVKFDDNYQRKVDDLAAKYPAKVLLNLE
jgi:ABC-type phosphate/phosphonate transport system substrate-binding protein